MIFKKKLSHNNSFKKIGQGLCSEVFCNEKNEIIKLFFPDKSHQFETEVKNLRILEGRNLPIPVIKEVINYNGRQGIIFENITKGKTLKSILVKKPWACRKIARSFAEVHSQIHNFKNSRLTPLKELMIQRLRESKIQPDYQKKIMKMYEALPDGDAICHSDFHIKNVIITPNGTRVIDWFRVSKGDPLSDVANALLKIKFEYPAKKALKLIYPLIKTSQMLFYDIYLKHYLDLNRDATLEQIQQWELPIAIDLALRGYPALSNKLSYLIGLIDSPIQIKKLSPEKLRSYTNRN